MDLQGKASVFPNPGNVLVSADRLTLREKALMLYRHAKAVALEREVRAIVKTYAASMVQDPHFTPERIRRLVKERLPTLLAELNEGRLTEDRLRSELHDAIRNPTERMRKAFRALDAAYKWFLISLLECGYMADSDEVQHTYEVHCPPDIKQPFHQMINDLSEAFVKVHTIELQKPMAKFTRIDWIHPSCRDLIIEELSTQPQLQKRFLQSMSLHGIKLAISDSGGYAGTRHLPLMNHPDDWEVLKTVPTNCGGG